MKPTIKTLITFVLLSSMVFSLQFCKKKDLTVKQDPKIANLIAELSSKPQLVFQRTVLTTEEIKQLIASTRSQSAKMMACPGTLYSAVVGYSITYQGGCSNADYKISITYLMWSDAQTDDGPRNHGNPDPTVSGVSLTINSNTVYPETVGYNLADDRAWWCTFNFKYSDVGLSLSASSIATTIFGTFTCANSATGNVNNNHTLSMNACNSVGVMYPNPSSVNTEIYFFFPWTLFCYPGLIPDAGFEIKYRVQGSSGSWTTVSSSSPVTGPFVITGLTTNTTYEYMSRYLCTGATGFWYFNTFTPQ